MVSFRGARKLSSYLVRAKFIPLNVRLDHAVVTKKQCQVCLNVTETDSLTSTSTNKAYKINHLLNCSKKMSSLSVNMSGMSRTVYRSNGE